MILTSSGKTPLNINYNGNDVKAVIFNGTTVWEKTKTFETWVLNADISSTMGSFANFSVAFKSDGIVFSSISINNSGSEKILCYDTINAYSAAQNKWATDGYRTLVLDYPPTGDFLTWLQANGTKK